MLHKEITDVIIKSFYKVYNELGSGFLESVYECAMQIELQNQGLLAFDQYPIKVYYDDQLVGDFKADLLVEQRVIVELKAVNSIHSKHEAQLINYLKATGIEVGLLMNFGPEPKFIRRVFSNSNN